MQRWTEPGHVSPDQWHSDTLCDILFNMHFCRNDAWNKTADYSFFRFPTSKHCQIWAVHFMLQQWDSWKAQVFFLQLKNPVCLFMTNAFLKPDPEWFDLSLCRIFYGFSAEMHKSTDIAQVKSLLLNLTVEVLADVIQRCGVCCLAFSICACRFLSVL